MEPESVVEGHQIETYRSLINIGTFALKFLQIVNGGAAIALLAYLGNVTARGRRPPDVVVPMILFIAGLVVAGVTTLTVYITQLTLYNEGLNELPDGRHSTWLNTSIVLAFVSLLCFAVGSVMGALAFRP